MRKVLARARSRRKRTATIVIALVAAVPVVVGATAAAAHPTASLPVPPSAVGARPAPHILDFARGLRGARLKLPKGPSHVTVAWNVDGCDHDYGRANQCVPWTIPAPAGHGCQWLAAHGFGPLKVRGRDRLGLDTNHDGIACDPGDAGA
jgi:hypothetical protein